MEENELLTDKKHITLLSLMKSNESKLNTEYAKDILNDIGVLVELVDSLNKQNIKMPEWKIWHEPLLIKLCFHASSLLRIFNGTILPTNNEIKTFAVFDEASIQGKRILNNPLCT